MCQSTSIFDTGRVRVVAAGVFLIAATAVERVHASEPFIFLVEEDWELVVNDPDVNINSPQIGFFLYPDASREDCYFQLQMNYAAEQGYSSGGFRVGAFTDEVPIDDERSDIRAVLAWDNDRIRWTSAMAAFDGKLMYALKQGYGYQWGHFGGPEYLVEMPQNGIASLSNYSPAKSLESVDKVFGANRVASIKLKRVRLQYSDGTIQSIEVNQDVD